MIYKLDKNKIYGILYGLKLGLNYGQMNHFFNNELPPKNEISVKLDFMEAFNEYWLEKTKMLSNKGKQNKQNKQNEQDEQNEQNDENLENYVKRFCRSFELDYTEVRCIDEGMINYKYGLKQL